MQKKKCVHLCVTIDDRFRGTSRVAWRVKRGRLVKRTDRIVVHRFPAVAAHVAVHRQIPSDRKTVSRCDYYRAYINLYTCGAVSGFSLKRALTASTGRCH